MTLQKTERRVPLCTIPDLPDTPEKGFLKFPRALAPKLWMLDKVATTYLALLYYARNDPDCWPSIETISAHTRKSRRTTAYNLRKLEKLGLIKTRHTKGTSSTYQIVNVYPE